MERTLKLPTQAIADRIMGDDDALPKFQLLRRYWRLFPALHHRAFPERGLNFLDEATKTEDDPVAFFYAATWTLMPYERAARMGHSDACLRCIYRIDDDPFDDEMRPRPGDIEFLTLAAAQGVPVCIEKEAQRLLLDAQQPLVAARMILTHPDGHVIQQWIQERAESVQCPLQLAYGWVHTREFYLYGKWQTQNHDIVGHYYNFQDVYGNVRRFAGSAAVTVMGLLRRPRYRGMVAKDVGFMIGRIIWESRELQTEEW